MRRLHQNGFTIIEMFVVILIIGLLLGVVSMGYRGIEARNNNQTRTTAINAIQRQLEAYNQTNSHYPSLHDMNSDTWLLVNMKSLDTALLQDPAANNTQLSAQPTAHQYAYQPLTSSRTSCEANDATCITYSLTATLEGGGDYIQQNTN